MPSAMKPYRPLRFDFIPYPIWRRRGFRLFHTALDGVTASGADTHPPQSPQHMAHYLARWRILPAGMDAAAARRELGTVDAPCETVDKHAAPVNSPALPMRLPAQWEPMEAIVMVFPVLYPPLWETHLQMIEAISGVARADVLIPDPTWAKPLWLHLRARGRATFANVRVLHLATDDIWVRDYGGFYGIDRDGKRAVVAPIYDPLESYPQDRDNAMPAHYAAHNGLPYRALDLHTEGGNFWSDGAGTLLTTDDIYTRHPDLLSEDVEERLSAAVTYDRLITIPPLWCEETGHVDLAIKLADARTILIGSESVAFNGARLREARERLTETTNAAGEPYRLLTLPMPAPYLNWGVYPVWRSYTNALTVNGRVLVPTFGVPEDALALRVYRDAMPEHDVCAIDCAASANGGGAVHCLTKEVPAGG